MTSESGKKQTKYIALILAAILAAALGCEQKGSPGDGDQATPAAQTPQESRQQFAAESQEPAPLAPANPAAAPSAEGEGQPVVTASESPAAEAKSNVTIEDLVRYRRSWDPIFIDYYGRPIPDFSVTDLAGKTHKLSEYKGKNVLLIFWATWCPPCKAEIPGLIEIRKEFSQDELLMLAVSNEDSGVVKRFAEQQELNYTVAAETESRRLPGPLNRVRAFPSAVFFDKEGKIKLAAEGMMAEHEIKAAIRAEK